MVKRALVVDDDRAACDLIREVLASSGMETLTLTNSGEAAEHLNKEKFAVALVDFRMPSPDGQELARQMRRGGFNQMTPIIMLSEDRELSAVSRGFQAGASFFLYKPVDKGRLAKLIRAARGAIEHEARRFRRIAFRSRVNVMAGNIEANGETINVSMDGLLMQTNRVIPIGTTVQVSLHLESGMKPMMGRGSVIRTVGEREMAIRLNELPLTENCRLQEFLLPMILENSPEMSMAGA